MLAAHGVRVDTLDMPKGRLTLSGVVKLYRLLRRERPDIVQTWMYHANLVGGVVAHLAGIRNIAWGLHQAFIDPKSSRLSTRLVNWCCARLSTVIPKSIVSCSQRGAPMYAKAGYEASKIVVIPNGYDVDQFAGDVGSRIAIRNQFSIPVDTFLIGMVARWHPVKDHANLLSALARLVELRDTPWRCLLVGAGTDASNVELGELIASDGLEARIVGVGQRTDIAAVMSSLDLHVLASRSEAFPNVVAESMACGTPCVVTDVGDAPHIVGDTGWVVPPKTPDVLADAIAVAMAAAQDAVAWDTRRLACRARVVENFSLSRMVASYRQVWSGMQQESA
jgi:glycosyltransferase involved in cell wall biosynthesis